MEQFDYKVFGKFIDGTGSEKENMRAIEWFAVDQIDDEFETELHKLWQEFPLDVSLEDIDSEHTHDRIRHLLKLEEPLKEDNKNKRNKFIYHLTRIAAVLFIPLALFVILDQWSGTFSGKNAVTYTEIYSPKGDKVKFTLPDGSFGWLNGDSYLTFPSQFSGDSRTVRLSGEGYFDVIKNPGKPFVVDSKGIKVIAYGTQFNVMAYEADRKVEVTLESGSVEIFRTDSAGTDKSIAKLMPGYKGAFIRGTSIHSVGKVNVSENISWKDGILVFRNDPMSEVVDRINRWYNVDLIIKDKQLESFTYRATFTNETLDDVLKLVQLTSPIVVRELDRKMLPDGTFNKRTIELYYDNL